MLSQVTFSAAEAGELFGIDPSTVRTWARRGKISVVGYDPYTGAGLYRYLDLVEVDFATRQSANSHRVKDRAP